VVFVPPDEGGYAIRDMEAGRDESRQASVGALKEWLSERRAAASSEAPR
jgi:hypothetical protein